MSAEQKRAWLAVISGVVCLALFGILAPLIGLMAATSAFALFAVNGLSPLIGRGEKYDERDLSIARKATIGGFAFSYLSFIVSLMLAWSVVYIVHGQSQICVHLLPMIAMIGFIVLYLVRAIMVLVLYRRHTEADDV